MGGVEKMFAKKSNAKTTSPIVAALDVPDQAAVARQTGENSFLKERAMADSKPITYAPETILTSEQLADWLQTNAEKVQALNLLTLAIRAQHFGTGELPPADPGAQG